MINDKLIINKLYKCIYIASSAQAQVYISIYREIL